MVSFDNIKLMILFSPTHDISMMVGSIVLHEKFGSKNHKTILCAIKVIMFMSLNIILSMKLFGKTPQLTDIFILLT